MPRVRDATREVRQCPTERPGRRATASRALPYRKSHYLLSADAGARKSASSSTAASRRSTPAACRRPATFSPTRCWRPSNDTTIGLTVAGALTPAGLGGCAIELMERGLVDFIISTGANLYHDLHYALNFTLHRGSPFLDDVELYEQGIIRIYDVLFPGDGAARNRRLHPRLSRALGAVRPDRDVGAPLSARPRSDRALSRLRGVFRRRPRRASRRADLHVVAGRQLDRHEHRVSRADERHRR